MDELEGTKGTGTYAQTLDITPKFVQKKSVSKSETLTPSNQSHSSIKKSRIQHNLDSSADAEELGDDSGDKSNDSGLCLSMVHF